MDAQGDDFFSAVIDAAPDGMLIVDADGTVRVANRQADELFGVESGDLVGTSVDGLLPGDLRQVHRAHRLRYRADPAVRPMGVGMLLRARKRDGTVFPVEVSLSPLQRGEEVMVVAAVRDVSSRVEAEDRMRRVLRTLDASEDAMFIMDADTLRFSYVNEGAARQVGYSTGELSGMSLLHINPELSEPGWRETIEPLISGEQPAVNLRTVHRRKDGVDVPVEMSLQTAPASRDGTVSVIAVARDMTARLEAEAQKRASERALLEAEQAMAVADDRERIARDLHDTVIQRLFASGLALQAVSTRMPDEPAARIEGIVTDLDETIRQIRTAIFALQATGPAESGVRGHLLEVVQEAPSSLGFEPRLQFDGPIETMEPAIADELLATLREALSNVARHAKAKTVRVIVDVGRNVTLTVADDGIGAPADVVGGEGIANMRARAEKLGGTCELHAVEPSGTRVVWQVPPTR